MASIYVPDYSKIFASGATSTQTWTDKDYNTGWGHLGQEPPPYELFDDLFKKLDEKDLHLFNELTGALNRIGTNESSISTLNSNVSTITSNFLNKNTGGTVSGSTTFSSYLSATRYLSTTDNSNYVPNTSWVQGLINYFLTTANNTQNNKFKNAVQDAIKAGYHGLTQDFSNPNSWWTKFPNGLIIQGGYISVPEYQQTTKPLPINFSKLAFKPLVTWDDPQQASNKSWSFVVGASCTTTSITIGLHTQNSGGDRGVNWSVFGY